MKKRYSLLFLGTLLIVLTASYISACGYDDPCDVDSQTRIRGKITFSETNDLVGGAQVTVTCLHNGNTYTKSTTSQNSEYLKGTYFVVFTQTQCHAGDQVTVTASKDRLTGINTDTVRDSRIQQCPDIDVSMINVSLIPEFGLLVGGLTILSAIGIFFIVRRK